MATRTWSRSARVNSTSTRRRGAAVPDATRGDGDAEHLLQAQRLPAELKIRGQAVPNAGLVLYRSDRIALHLDHVCASGQSERLRPERNATQDPAAPAPRGAVRCQRAGARAYP